MDDKPLPTKTSYVLYCCHVEGTRSRGRQTQTWMDNVRQDTKTYIDMGTAIDTIRGRKKWRRFVKKNIIVCTHPREERKEEEEEKIMQHNDNGYVILCK